MFYGVLFSSQFAEKLGLRRPFLFTRRDTGTVSLHQLVPTLQREMVAGHILSSVSIY